MPATRFDVEPPSGVAVQNLLNDETERAARMTAREE